MRLVPLVIEEEGYEEPSCSSSSRFIRDDVDELCLPSYDEVIRYKYTSFVGQMFSGKNFKESFQYFMEYYSLKKEIMDFLSFRDYCYLEIHKLFKYPCYQSSIENISHMVDEVCMKVWTIFFPPGAKRDKEVKPKLWQEEI